VNLSSRYQEEMDYRRLLFKAAAKGDLRAQEALEREYHVRVLRKKTGRRKNSRPKSKKVDSAAKVPSNLRVERFCLRK
jgi:hypothetical protein